jgi:hypothetical protein
MDRMSRNSEAGDDSTPRAHARWLVWDVVAIALLLLLGLVINGPNGNAFGHDMAFYLAGADSLKATGRVINVAGDPEWQRLGFYWLVGTTQDVFGRSLIAVAWLISFLASALVVAVYLAARAMFDRSVALAAAATTLLSTGYIYYSVWHVDSAWPPFVLGSLALLAVSGERWCVHRGALAGASAVVAFVIKETAVFFLVVPLLWRLTDRRAIGWRTVLAFYLVAGAILCIWLVVVFLPAVSAKSEYATAASALSEAPMNAWQRDGLWGVLSIGMLGLWGYFFDLSKWTVAESFPVLPLLGVVGAVTLARGLMHGGPFRLAALCLCAYMPLVAFIGFWAMRPSQLLFFNAILLICFFALVGDLTTRAMQRKRSPIRSVRAGIFATLVALLTAWQAVFGYPAIQYALQHSFLAGLVFGKREPIYLPAQEVAEYLVKHARTGDEVGCLEIITCNALAWRVPQLKLITVPQHYIANELGWRAFVEAPSDGTARPLSIGSNWRDSFAASRRWQRRGAFLLLYEQPLLQRLTRPDLKYLVVETNSQFPNLVAVLDQTTGLARVLTVDTSRAYHYAVYLRTADELTLPQSEAIPLVTLEARQFADWLIKGKSDQYRFFSRRLPGAARGRTLEDLVAEHSGLQRQP